MNYSVIDTVKCKFIWNSNLAFKFLIQHLCHFYDKLGYFYISFPTGSYLVNFGTILVFFNNTMTIPEGSSTAINIFDIFIKYKAAYGGTCL